MKKYVVIISTILFAIIFVILLNIGNVNALDSIQKGPHHKIMEQLTEEQQKEVKAKMQKLWESGASKEEIRDSVKEMIKEYGVEVPEDFNGFRGERGPRNGRGFLKFTDQLSEDQENAIKAKVKTLHDEGATREEIHAEVTAMLKEYGIEIPDDFEGFRGKRGNRPGRGWMHFEDELTDEQRAAIRVKMREMRKDDATPKEIKEEIHKMLREFGINKSDDQTNQSAETLGETLSVKSYPNPFNPETNIEYNLKSSSQVSITIYDVQGKQVRLLINDHRQAGMHTIKWDGLNENGSQVPSGVYFFRISAGNETLNHRIVMMK